MFKNHIKIAWRNLRGQPFFTLLNLFGLAIGITGGLLIGLYVADEMGYDQMFPDASRMYRINVDQKFGGESMSLAVTAPPMAAALTRDLPQVESSMRFRDVTSVLVKPQGKENNIKQDGVMYADSTLFQFLGLPLLYGDARTALREPNTLVLTQTAAEKYFPVDQAVGRMLVLDNNETYRVTGVLEDLPRKSFLRDRHMFLAMSGYAHAQEASWTGQNFYTLFKLRPDARITDIALGLEAMVDDYVIPHVQQYFPGITKQQLIASGNYLRYSAIPLTEVHLYSHRVAELSVNGDIQNIYILLTIGLFLILLAGINFMNLSTARSLKRAKEVGIRKTMGSKRPALVGQFLVEAMVMALCALILALFLTLVALPFYNQLTGKELSLPYGNPFFWTLLIGGTVLFGLFAGSYPAFSLSKYLPVKVLKGHPGLQKGEGGIRNILVVFQFAVSIFLILGTIVVYLQLHFIQDKDLGYDKEQVVVVNNLGALGHKQEVFKQRIQQLVSVDHTTLSDFFPTPSARNSQSFIRADDRDQERAINMQNWRVDEDYLATMDLDLVSGRNFDPRFGTDSTAILLNETAVSILGSTPEEVLGMRFVRNPGEANEYFIKVIGVVRDFNFESLRDRIGALGLSWGRNSGALAVKLDTGRISQGLSEIEGIWNEMAPGQPFGYYFMDTAFEDAYQADQRLGTILIVFTLLSILIACLGLFGLAAFNAEKRTKEVGIRKVLGASVGQVAYKLSLDFLKLVGLAILIALPVGWWAMDRWLQDFSYRIAVPWWALLGAAFLAVAIALLTVSYQSIRAALANPVKSLRME